jgi:hypothetical protein
LLPLALAGLGALLGWTAGIVLLKHDMLAEFELLRRKVFRPAGAGVRPDIP